MNEHHAPKDDARFHQMSSAVPAANPMPVLKATTTSTSNLVPAAAIIPNHAAAHAAQTMAYNPESKTSDEGPPRKDSNKRPSDGTDPRKKSSETRKKSDEEEHAEDVEDEKRHKINSFRRESVSQPVDPEEVLKFLRDMEADSRSGMRPIAHVGTTVDQRDQLPQRKLKSHPPPATKDLYKDNDKIKLNRSYKLRYNFLRKQGSVPSSMQMHMERFKKPPFKRVWKPGWCVDNISDRLARLREKQQKP
ncbi:hypothetical protein V9T40_005972 [Parthenolecanium corni]|uniref:Uncharacterized protein n=1 Tax=Parthenolecanium corni TaxID=536013 RepID=A0AAN9TX76_9HEMI